MSTYKPLGVEYKKNGFNHTQLFREGDVAIFHKVHIDPIYDAGFEVVVISRHEEYEMGGNKIEAAEAYPSPEMWGTRGWTFTASELLKARNKYEKILKGDLTTDVVVEVVEEPVVAVKERAKRGAPKADLTIPVGEFSIGELAEKNQVDYNHANLFIKSSPSIQFVREERRNARGKMTKLFSLKTS